MSQETHETKGRDVLLLAVRAASLVIGVVSAMKTVQEVRSTLRQRRRTALIESRLRAVQA